MSSRDGQGSTNIYKGVRRGGQLREFTLGFEQMDINICFGEEASRGPKHESV